MPASDARRTAIVTGGAQGIGYAIASRLYSRSERLLLLCPPRRILPLLLLLPLFFYLLLVVYASLFPFEHWRWPPGQALVSLLALPWPPWKDPFDLWANLLGYVPWGLLLIVALLGAGRRLWQAWALALLLTAAMSYLTEVTQIFLPNRHPSLKDVAMNRRTQLRPCPGLSLQERPFPRSPRYSPDPSRHRWPGSWAAASSPAGAIP